MSEAVLDTAPAKPDVASSPVERDRSASWACPECMAPFRRRQPHQLFCCTSHKRAWHNRWMGRGAVLAPLQASARATRGGSRGDKPTGSRARADAEHLLQRWKDEDAGAKPPRMPIDRVVAERYRLGLVEVA
jgi:hypothetical protein